MWKKKKWAKVKKKKGDLPRPTHGAWYVPLPSLVGTRWVNTMGNCKYNTLPKVK